MQAVDQVDQIRMALRGIDSGDILFPASQGVADRIARNYPELLISTNLRSYGPCITAQAADTFDPLKQRCTIFEIVFTPDAVEFWSRLDLARRETFWPDTLPLLVTIGYEHPDLLEQLDRIIGVDYGFPALADCLRTSRTHIFVDSG